MSLIVLKNIKKEYGKNQVLFNDLSLEIEQGEFVGLIGKSGSVSAFIGAILSLLYVYVKPHNRQISGNSPGNSC